MTSSASHRDTLEQRAEEIVESYQAKWGSLVHISDLKGLIFLTLIQTREEALKEASKIADSAYRNEIGWDTVSKAIRALAEGLEKGK